MDHSLTRRKKARWARAHRVRNKVRGTSQRPRLSISKTNRHLYAQVIDDEKGITLFGIGTMGGAKKGKQKSKEAAREIGMSVAKQAKERQIETVVFDRGRNKYHGIIAELASGAREAGLQF